MPITYTQEHSDHALTVAASCAVLPNDAELTAETLVSWATSVIKNDARHKAYIVIGIDAILTMPEGGWFIQAFDLTGSNRAIRWWGSIFGLPVFVFLDLTAATWKLNTNAIYVVSDDGATTFSRMLT